MNIFRKKNFLLKSFVKIELSHVFTINMLSTAENCMEVNYLTKTGVFLLFVIIYVPLIILDSCFLT